MANSFHALEWHVLEDEGKAEEQWPSLVDDDASPPQLVTVPQRQHLYELLFLIVVVLGIVAGLLWQRADQRIAQLETDLTALHEEFAQSQRQKVLKGTSDGWVSTIGNQPQPQRNSIFRCGGDLLSAQHSPASNVADPLIEYILVTYGNTVVPALFGAFEEHTTWKTLTPVLFGVTAEQFEADWHDYLHNTYPLAGD